MHSGEIEVLIAKYLNPRINLIVPNISWGLDLHEIDLLVLTKSGYAWEIEIKTSLSDLKADKKKKHGHYSNKIHRLYFAVPAELKEEALLHIPERAGLFITHNEINLQGKFGCVSLVRAPKLNTKARKFNDKEIKHLYELTAMRIWSLKEIIYKLQKEKK
jgi:hypothetical protein